MQQSQYHTERTRYRVSCPHYSSSIRLAVYDTRVCCCRLVTTMIRCCSVLVCYFSNNALIPPPCSAVCARVVRTPTLIRRGYLLLFLLVLLFALAPVRCSRASFPFSRFRNRAGERDCWRCRDGRLPLEVRLYPRIVVSLSNHITSYTFIIYIMYNIFHVYTRYSSRIYNQYFCTRCRIYKQ